MAGNKDGSVDPLLNGELGALVDPDDVEEIAAALIAILQRQKGTRSGGFQPPRAAGKPPLPAKSQLSLPDIMFDPEALRACVIEEFGFEAFKQRLSEILSETLKR